MSEPFLTEVLESFRRNVVEDKKLLKYIAAIKAQRRMDRRFVYAA